MHGVRLLYLVYNENLLQSGILRVQVRRMLEELRKLAGIESITLLSYVSPPLYFKQRRSFKRLKAELADCGIDLRTHLMPAATAWGWPTPFLSGVWCLPSLLMELSRSSAAVIHSRSYGAGFLAAIASRMTGCKHIFDPRGAYPEELVTNGLWRRSGWSFRLWKWIEKKLIRGADAVVGVTPAYKREFIQRKAKRAVFIPNRCDLAAFSTIEVSPRHSTPVTLFVGEMDSKWYAPEYIAGHFLRIRAVIPQMRFLTITRTPQGIVRESYHRAGLPDECFEIQGVPPKDVPALLATGTVALVAQSIDNVWPVKFAECLAAGLPLILNRRAGKHLTGPVEKFGLGVVVDIDEPESYIEVGAMLANLDEYRIRARAYAVRRMGIDRTAKQHNRLYRTILAA